MALGNEFLAAIFGAVVGGLIAALIQLITLHHTNSKETKRDLEQKQALGRGLLFKLMRIEADLNQINQHLNYCKNNATPDMLKEPWSYMMPIANLPDPIKISPEEVSLVIGPKNNEILNNLLDLEHVHKSSLSVMRQVGKTKEKVSRKMGRTNYSGTIGIRNVPPKLLSKLRPDMISMSSLVKDAHSRSQRDYDLAQNTLQETNRILSEEICLKFKLRTKTQEEKGQ